MLSKKEVINLFFAFFAFILIIYSGFSRDNLFFGIDNIKFISLILILFLFISIFKRKNGRIFVSLFFFSKIIFIQIFLKYPLNLFSFLIYLGFTLLFFSAISIFNEKISRYLIFFSLFLIGIIGTVDILYFNYFNDFPSVLQISEISLLPKIKKSLFYLFNLRNLLIIVDIFLIPIFFKPRIEIKKKIILPIFLIAILFIVFSSFYLYNNKKELFVKRFQNKFLVEKTGVIGFHFYDIFYNLKRKIVYPKISSNVLGKIQISFIKSKKSIEEESPFKGIFKNYNLIIIQEESIAQWALDKTIFKEEITPFLNEMKKKAIYFENFFEQTNQGRTSDSEFSSLNSLINFSAGSINYIYPTNKYYTLAHRAKEGGYKTIFFHPFDGGFWARNLIIPNYGFDEMNFKEKFEEDEKIGWGLSNHSLYRQITEKLKKEEKPFFAYIVTLTGHHPFDEISERKEYGNYDGYPKIINNYLKLCKYKDDSLKYFVNLLEENNFFNDTVLIYYGDHDPGIYYEDIKTILQKPCQIKEEYYSLERVPFFIYNPKIMPMKIKKLCGHIDIAPTIVYLFGFKDNNWNYLGRNLFSNEDNFFVHTDGVVFSENKFYDLKDCYERITGRKIEITECEILKKEYENKKLSSYWIMENNYLNFYMK